MAILGLQLYGGKYFEELKQDLAIHYDSFYWALIASFQIITLDGWADAMAKSHKDFGAAWIIFYFLTTLVARAVIMVAFIAIRLNQVRTGTAVLYSCCSGVAVWRCTCACARLAAPQRSPQLLLSHAHCPRHRPRHRHGRAV